MLIAALAAIGFVAHLHHEGIAPKEPIKRVATSGLLSPWAWGPTKAQWASWPSYKSQILSTVHVSLVNPTAQGDTVVFALQWGSASDTVSTVVDDKGGSLVSVNPWAKDKIQANGGNAQSVGIIRRSNCPAGMRVITVTFSSPMSFVQPLGVMCCNNLAPVSPVITTSGGNPTGTSLAPGNLVVGNDQVFVVVAMAQTSGVDPASWTRFTAPSKYAIWAPDGNNESCCMYGFEPAQGTFNPALSTNGHSIGSSAVAAVAYKTAAGVGRGPTGGGEIQIFQTANFNYGGGQGTTLTIDLPFQPDINFVNYGYDDGGANFASPAANTSSSPANTWQLAATAIEPSGPTVGMVFAENAQCSLTGSLTITIGAQPTHTTVPFELYIWGTSGAGEVDQIGSGHGTLASTPPVTQNNMLSSALVPTQPNEILFYVGQEDSQTVVDITATSGSFLTMMPASDTYESLDAFHDAGAGHLYAGAAGTSYNINSTWAEREGNSDHVGPWAAVSLTVTTTGPRVTLDYQRFPKVRLRRLI